MNTISIFKTNEDGSGTLVKVVGVISIDAALAIMQALKDSDGGNYIAEILIEGGSRVIGQV
jgi:riboflavin biosynthesis pyrimidine reductase